MHIGADDLVRGATVRVMPHSICGLSMRVVSIENGSGGSSPGCISSADQSMVRPSSRGGVPVFKRPSAKPALFERRRKSQRRRFADAAGGNLLFADMDEAAQECAGGEHHGAAGNLAAIGEFHAADAAIFENEIVGFGFDDLEIGRRANRGLHGLGVELAVGLGARAAHGRAFAAVQDAELDAAGVGDAAHEAVQSVDFPHQMALAEPANGRIAGHGADGRESMRHQGRFRAHAGRGSRGLAAGMAAANDDDVELRIHALGLEMGF